MKIEALRYLVCPLCKMELEVDPAPPDQQRDEELLVGTLRCLGCRRAFPIVDGVPRMVVTPDERRGPAETCGFQWLKHSQRQLEGDTVYGRSQAQDVAYFLEATGLAPHEVAGKVILDAGCGSGQLTEGLGRLGARAVIGIDVHTAIDAPFRRCRALANVHVVSADIRELPFRPDHCDLVWSQGVIHPLPDPPRAVASLAATVVPGGTLSVWVYERRWSPFRSTRDVLNLLGLSRLSLSQIMLLTRIVSAMSVVVHGVYRAIRQIPFLRPKSFADRRTTQFRSLSEFHLTWFDVLSPKYDRRYTEEEVASWFRDHGFTDLVAYRDRVGIRGTKAPNGSTARSVLSHRRDAMSRP